MLIDLRSDTVTRPSPGMRRAMYEAEVGDDVFGEDPTVRRLEAFVAELLGKEAALFVPSGVMGNQLAIKVLTHPGDEVILGRESHIFNYESGAPALISGVQLHPLDDTPGWFSPEALTLAVRHGHDWEPRSRLVCLENTHNRAGGVVVPLDVTEAVAAEAHRRGLALHLDGARLWHASVALGVPEHRLAAPFDMVSVCLSKGLGAPVGSLLAASTDLIAEARRFRKLLGGGMRQVGVLAAAGLYALEHHRPLLAEDHAKARRLAEGIAELPAFEIDLKRVQTNIVRFDVRQGTAENVLAQLREEGVLMVAFGPRTIRATTHRDVSMQDIDRTLAILHRLFGRPSA